MLSQLEIAGGARVGRIARWSDDGRPYVTYPGGPPRPVVARLAIGERDAALLREPGVPVLLLLAEEEPILLGTVRETLPAAEPVRVALDRREEIVLEADRRIVLRCGKGSITLERDGRIVVRGTRLLSRATGPHRIQGGTVQIN